MMKIPLQIRPSDCDSLDHVNNSAYVAYVQHAVAKFLSQQGYIGDWARHGGYHWTMQELAIEYRLATSFGDQLMAQVWVAQNDGLRPLIGCEITNLKPDGPQVVLRSQSRWQRLDKDGGQPAALTHELPVAPAEHAGQLPRAFKTPREARDARRYHWQHRVERAEAGLGGSVHPHVLFEWIEESILSASATAGWPIERYLAVDFIVFQMRHDACFHALPVLGDVVEITSRLVNVRRLGGTWHNKIRNKADDQLLVSNYSTGVFLNLSGRPTSPPPGMIEALQAPTD